MSLMTEPVIKQPRHIPDTRTAKDWLDALASGACDQRSFLRGLGELLGRAPDSGWDMLALLDQYYRRGKISADTFAALKGHLQNLLMGKSAGDGGPAIPVVCDELVKLAAGPSPVISLPTGDTRAPAESRGASADARGAPSAPPSAVRPAVEPLRQRVDCAPSEGSVLRGRYRLDRLLGQGGTGAVFEAVDLSRVEPAGREQTVAVKVLHSAVTKRPRLLAALRREFQHQQGLSHPNIVRVHEFDRDGDVAFYTMEYLHGTTLQRLLAARQPHGVDRERAFGMIRDIGAALTHAHSRGLVHGDLNPAKVFVTESGGVRILDFGASMGLRRPSLGEDEEQPAAAVDLQTFASCEVLQGATAEESDDVYALACVAYLLLAGHHPFHDISSLKARSLKVSPQRPPGLTRGQWRTLQAGLELDRAKRPGDVASWVATLDTGHAGRRPPLPPARPASGRRRPGVGWVAGGLSVALLATAAWWASGHVELVEERGAAWLERLRALGDRASQAVSGGAAPMLPAPASRGEASPQPVGDAAMPAAAPVAADPRAADPRPSAPADAAPTRPAPGGGAHAAGASEPEPAIQPPPRAASSPITRPAPSAAASDLGPPGTRAKIELATDNVEVAPGDATAKIIVKRTRSLRGEASFSWWTESGTAKPGQDFVAVKSHVETMPGGKSSMALLVPIVEDPGRRQERNFYVVIDEPSDNASLGRTLTMVTIPPPATD